MIMRESSQILLVEDNPGDIDLVKEALGQFETPPQLKVVSNGGAALEILREFLPDMILLDLNIPGIDGREVLSAVKQDDRMRHIPVVVLTSSSAERDLIYAYQCHANCFITKPGDVEEFFRTFKALEQFWFSVVTLPPR